MLQIRRRLAGLGLIAVVSGCGVPKATLVHDLDQTREKLLELEVELDSKDESNERLAEALEAAEREAAGLARERTRLAEQIRLESQVLQADRERELEVYNQLASALQALSDEALLEIVSRRGQLMIEIQESVLFPSGRAKLTTSGKQTLLQVTQALLSVPGCKFMIAGHTDAAPIRSRADPHLSLERASSVLRFMADRGFPRERLSAVGYDAIDPLESNDTPEGRARNRRIELVLVPELSRALELAPTPASP